MLRKTIFWIHLSVGICTGLVIAIMSFTGAALAFEKEITASAEREARQVQPPTANAAPLPLEQLLQRVPAMNPTARIASIAVSKDPGDALAIGLPGNVTLYANPYTGELREGQ